MMRRAAGAAAMLSLLAVPLAQAATGMAKPLSGGTRMTTVVADPALAAAAAEIALPAPASSEAALAGGVEVAKKKGGGRPKAGGAKRNRGGANVRKGGNTRYKKGGNFKSGNTVVVNRGRPGYGYYDDDDNDGLAGALVGGVIGLGVGAAIANSGSTDNTCVDNNGDGQCDAY